MKNSVVASLYISHCSGPIAALSSVYSGSRSIRAGTIWPDLVVFREPEPEPDRDFADRTGVERLTDGRLKAAGSMSGIVVYGAFKGGVACGGEATRNVEEGS